MFGFWEIILKILIYIVSVWVKQLLRETCKNNLYKLYLADNSINIVNNIWL